MTNEIKSREDLNNVLENLTVKEIAVLHSLYLESAGNGHDFGQTKDANYGDMNPHAYAALVGSIYNKDLIYISEQHDGYEAYELFDFSSAAMAWNPDTHHCHQAWIAAEVIKEFLRGDSLKQIADLGAELKAVDNVLQEGRKHPGYLTQEEVANLEGQVNDILRRAASVPKPVN